jgi:hypothetical protein
MTMTQSKTRTNLVNLIQLLFQPETWTLAEPLTKSDYTPNSKPPVVCTLLPPSTQTFEQGGGYDLGGDGVQSQYAIDVQLSFLFPNDMLFHQLPINAIVESMGWLCVLISQHPTLLQINKSQLHNLTNWQYGLLNQCLYDNADDNPNQIIDVNTSWEIAKVQETKIKDWLILISLQVRIKETCDISEYVPNPNQLINPYPNPLGGVVTSPIPPFVLLNNFIYGQYVPVAPGTLNSEAQKHPHPYMESDQPDVGHNASFDAVVQQGLGVVPKPLPVVTGLPIT